MTDLKLASTDDIIDELRRRRLHFALYLDLLPQYKPGGDLPPEKRHEVYGTDRDEENPARLAGRFCNGILRTLLKVESPPEALALTVDLSRQTNRLKKNLWLLAKVIDPTL
jgi:hypothetical protein